MATEDTNRWRPPTFPDKQLDIAIKTIYDIVYSLPPKLSAIQILIDGGGAVPPPGFYGHVNIPFNCTITGWLLSADLSGSAVIDVLRAAYNGYPTLGTIAGNNRPTLASAVKAKSTSLAGWGSKDLKSGDVVQINLVSVATCRRLSLTINLSVP